MYKRNLTKHAMPIIDDQKILFIAKNTISIQLNNANYFQKFTRMSRFQNVLVLPKKSDYQNVLLLNSPVTKITKQTWNKIH